MQKDNSATKEESKNWEQKYHLLQTSFDSYIKNYENDYKLWQNKLQIC
jgi:hypothetical protein